MEGRKIAIVAAVILVLFTVAVVIINPQLYAGRVPSTSEEVSYSVRVWGVVDTSIWETYSNLRVNTMFTTVTLYVENIGNQDIHNITFDYVIGGQIEKSETEFGNLQQTLERVTYSCGDIQVGMTKNYILTRVCIRDYVGHPRATFNFQCDELPKDRNYNAAAFGVIFLDLRWQPGGTHSNEEAFSF